MPKFSYNFMKTFNPMYEKFGVHFNVFAGSVKTFWKIPSKYRPIIKALPWKINNTDYFPERLYMTYKDINFYFHGEGTYVEVSTSIDFKSVLDLNYSLNKAGQDVRVSLELFKNKIRLMYYKKRGSEILNPPKSDTNHTTTVPVYDGQPRIIPQPPKQEQ